MKIIFRDLNPAVAQAVRDAFSDVPAFDVHCAEIFSYGPADAIISPANSYGWMDGGIDLLYCVRFGWHIQSELMELIRSVSGGLLPVGQALVIQTGSAIIPAMISAPTMEVPMPVPHTRNAYLAFGAALRTANEMNFQTVLCPGLATLTGRMHPGISARQMREAWDEMYAIKAES